MNNLDSELSFLILALIIIVLAIFIFGIIPSMLEFLQELRYLNSEIRRAKGSDIKRWRRKRRKLWLSLLPFVKY